MSINRHLAQVRARLQRECDIRKGELVSLEADRAQAIEKFEQARLELSEFDSECQRLGVEPDKECGK